jgi:hypothetical protein
MSETHNGPNDDIENLVEVVQQRRWRVGGGWQVTIVAIGDEDQDDTGRRRPDDILLGMALRREVAELICAEHNTLLDWRS